MLAGFFFTPANSFLQLLCALLRHNGICVGQGVAPLFSQEGTGSLNFTAPLCCEQRLLREINFPAP